MKNQILNRAIELIETHDLTRYSFTDNWNKPTCFCGLGAMYYATGEAGFQILDDDGMLLSSNGIDAIRTIFELDGDKYDAIFDRVTKVNDNQYSTKEDVIAVLRECFGDA